MLLRCVASAPSESQASELAPRFRGTGQVFPVTVGEDYTAYGIEQDGRSVWVFVEHALGYLVSVPLLLFEISEGSIPASWRARLEQRQLVLLPPELDDVYFLDDLSSGNTEAITRFAALKDRLRDELP